jgi:hypothetical protein
MFNIPWMKKKDMQKAMPASVAHAEKLLPDSIKNMSAPALAKKINEMNRPNKWAITRFAASGKLHKTFAGGNYYPPDMSEKRRQRYLRQIEKGIIQVTPKEEM